MSWLSFENNVIMKLFLLLAIAASAVVAEDALDFEPITTFYHEAVGIPEAARIKRFEEELNFDETRIVGGSSAFLGQFPYQVNIAGTM